MAEDPSTKAKTECNVCNINNCFSLQRIVQLCNKYEDWLYNEQNKNVNPITNALKPSFNSYLMHDVVKDYNHIKEKKYNLSSINKLCSRLSINCVPTQRHRRDNNSNYQKQYFSQNIPDIITQRLLDQIHIFLYHPLINNIKEEDQQNQRFGTKVSTQNKQKNEKELIQNNPPNEEEEEEKYPNIEEKKDENIEVDLEKDAYNFGQQFFYWHYYKEHRWFITPKYHNLKEELLINEICKIDTITWNMEYQEALNKLEDDERVKSLRSNNEFSDKYDIKEDIAITMNHLLSILFYCGTDILQNRFSATYRRLSNEHDLEFKERHSHFYYFGRFLRESVEVFGNVLVDEDFVLYHGVDHPLYFTKMIAKFYSPTSTSKNRGIAQRFAGNDGMILEFGKYERNAFYFDCFLSAYPQEEECLFIGGYAALKITNILHFMSESEEIESYSKYIKCIECLLSALVNGTVEEEVLSSLQDKNNILRTLINNRCYVSYMKRKPLPISDYVSKLFQFRCDKITQLSVNIMDFIQVSKVLNIHDVCIDDDTNMIKINLMIQLFPNITRIRIVVPNDFVFNEQINCYLLGTLSEYAIRSLSNFQFIEFNFSMQELVHNARSQLPQSWQKKLENIGWILSFQKNEEDDESVYFVKVNDNFIGNISTAIDTSSVMQTLIDKQNQYEETDINIKLSSKRKKSFDDISIYKDQSDSGDEDDGTEVGRLSKKRKEKLTYGYIRQQCREYTFNVAGGIVPNELINVCLRFVGTKDFYKGHIEMSYVDRRAKEMKVYVSYRIIIWLFIGIIIFYANLTKQNSLTSNISKGRYPVDTPQKYCCDCYNYALDQQSKPKGDARRIDMSYCVDCFNCTACQANAINQTWNNNQCEGRSGAYKKGQCDTKYASATTMEIFYKNYNTYGIGALAVCILYVTMICCISYCIKMCGGTQLMAYNLIIGLICLYTIYKPYQYQKTFIADNENGPYCYVNTINETLEDVISVFVYGSCIVILFHFFFGFFYSCIFRRGCLGRRICGKLFLWIRKWVAYITGIGSVAFFMTIIVAVIIVINHAIAHNNSDDIVWLIVVSLLVTVGLFDIFFCGTCRDRFKRYYNVCCRIRSQRNYNYYTRFGSPLLDDDNEMGIIQNYGTNLQALSLSVDS